MYILVSTHGNGSWWMKLKVSEIVLPVLLLLLLGCPQNGESSSSKIPEFTEPIKNITISEGTNVEFSCHIKYLGNYRVMWLKKDERKETFVAINLLKITKNPRITVTLFQSSDDVTQSNVYIQNTVKDDTAVYECAVNTNPMISQTGSLDVTTSSDKAGPFTPDSPIQHQNHEDEENSTPHNMKNYYNEPVLSSPINIDNGPNPNISIAINNENDTEIMYYDDNSTLVANTTLCSGMKSFWEEATDSIKKMLQNVLDSLVNFTCSFLTPPNT